MKKILLLAAGLMIAGSSFAAPCDKHKDKTACSKTSKEACKEKSCCKKGTATTSSSKSTKTETTAKK
jgi:hypothetical protein